MGARLDRAMDALGSPTRRAILHMLRAGPRAVGEIAEPLPISRPAVSKHLRVLEAARLVRHHADGNRNVFALDVRGFDLVRSWIDDFWDEALPRFAAEAER